MLGQRRRRCYNVVQMLYKCFVFAGYNMNDIQYTDTRTKRVNDFAKMSEIMWFSEVAMWRYIIAKG